MISTPIQEALSEQLNREFYSAYLYLAMAAYCSNEDFNGAAQWLELQYEEEILHATKIYRYLIEQAVPVRLASISEPPSEFGTLLEVFQSSLHHEQAMTSQVEEEATVNGIIAKLKMVKGDGYGMLMVDNELGTRTASLAPAPPA